MPTPYETDFPSGSVTIRAYGDQDRAGSPIVLMFMDAFGPRPALERNAERLAAEGCRVLLPDLFYDQQPYVPLDPASVFSGGADRGRLGTLISGVTPAKIEADVEALIAFAGKLDPQAPLVAVGYCMGGRYALTAAALSPRVALAASIHGSTLAPEGGEGVHTRVAGSGARIYVGVAGIDPTFDAAEAGRLATALREGGVDHAIETYAGAPHGFTMNDLPAYNEAAAERHLQRLSSLLREVLA